MNDDHIHPDFRDVLLMSDEERIAFMDQPRWIGYTHANKVIDILRSAMDKPIKPRMQNYLIVGDSNNGKTTLINRFKELHGEGYVDENSEPVKPVVLMQSPPSADEKSLYISLLEMFWTPYRATDSTAKLRFQVLHLMRHCHVKVLVIDEFHSLLTGSAVKQREVMNALKYLCNELKIPIVGVGTRLAIRVLHTDPQHASRFDVVPLPLWELNKDFQQLLASFEQVLPLKQKSTLHQPNVATLLHTVSEGNLGNLHRLLIECAKDAITQGAEKITLDIIKNNKSMRPTKGIREIAL